MSSGTENKFASYGRISRLPSSSFLFIIPLILLYEFSVFMLSATDRVEVRNGADVLLKMALDFLGVHDFSVFFLIFIAVGFLALYKAQKIPKFQYIIFPLMFFESCAYALFFGYVVRFLTGLTILTVASALPFKARIVVSLGAGIYEEFVFRVVLVGILFFLFRRGLAFSKMVSYLFAVLLSSLVFSGAHYVGPYGDNWFYESFMFRFFSGIMFCGIYVLRGFGITAYTHSLYDLFLTCGVIG